MTTIYIAETYHTELKHRSTIILHTLFYLIIAPSYWRENTFNCFKRIKLEIANKCYYHYSDK